MTTSIQQPLRLAAAVLLAGGLGACGMFGEKTEQERVAEQREEMSNARDLVQQSAEVVRKMKADPELAAQMSQAKGILIVPDFARGAFIVGGRGGEGVVLSRQQGQWSNPAFYNVGGISVGPQVGAEAGQVAFLLMSDKAVDAFKEGDNFSLNAEAGLTIVDWSASAQASLGQSDVVAWSDTQGLFGGADIGVSDVAWDEDENRAYYGTEVSPQAILSGQVRNPQAMPLQRALTG